VQGHHPENSTKFHHGPEQEYNLTTLKSHPYQQHASLGLAKPKMKVRIVRSLTRPSPKTKFKKKLFRETPRILNSWLIWIDWDPYALITTCKRLKRWVFVFFFSAELDTTGTDHQRLDSVCVLVWFGKVKQGSLVKELFESRERAEEEESNANDGGSLRNRLHVSSLVRLLEERRDLDLADGGAAAAGSRSASVNVRKASSLLAEKYGMDVEKVERLVRFVNVPSVREGEKNVRRRYVRDAESGEEVAITEVSLYFSPFFFQNVFFWGRWTNLLFCSSPPTKRSELTPFFFIFVVLGRVEGTNEYCAARIKSSKLIVAATPDAVETASGTFGYLEELF
jgi:hypothetical protein